MRAEEPNVDGAQRLQVVPPHVREPPRLAGLVVDLDLHFEPAERQAIERRLGPWLPVMRVALGMGHRFFVAAGIAGTGSMCGETAATEDDLIALFERMNREIEGWRSNETGAYTTAWELEVGLRLADRLKRILTPPRRH